MLSESDFNQGLAASLPKDMKIANKYGLHSSQGDPDRLLLHDCGIIYAPYYPYLLCVMTEGDKDQSAELTSLISEISKIIYENLEN